MAENFVVLPFDTRIAADLAMYGVPHPAPPAEPRSPTPREVIVAICGLSGLEATVRRCPDNQLIRIDLDPSGTGHVRPAGAGTEVSLREVVDDASPCQITFRGGTIALVAMVVERIAMECGGPLVLWPASGEDPVVING